MGGQLGGRLFGTGATELGTTQKEIELKKQLINLDADSRKAILETNKLIQAALLETQEKFADKVNDTATALDEAGDKFDELTQKLKVLVPQLQGGGNPQAATGGKITGPSHSNGGVDIEAEGGEFIIRKSATSKLQKQMPGLLESLNKGRIPRKMQDGGPTDEEEFDFRRRLYTPTRPKPKRRPSTPNTSPKTPRTELDRNPIGTVTNAPTLQDFKDIPRNFTEITGLGDSPQGNSIGSIGFLLGAENPTGNDLIRGQNSRRSQLEKMDDPLAADRKIKELREQGYNPESRTGTIGPTLTGSGSLRDRGLLANIVAAEGFLTGNDREAQFQESVRADQAERKRKTVFFSSDIFSGGH